MKPSGFSKKKVSLIIRKHLIIYFMNIGDEILYQEYKKKLNIYDGNIELKIKNIEAAYNKAWECRNFEIDKVWPRATFFWAFIALAFGAYGYLFSKHPAESSNNASILYMRLELLCILVGAFFSFIWTQIIYASKIWQENWETHIELLENYICGSLYKIVLSEKKYFPSISKLAKYVSWGILVVWGLIFIIHANQYWRKDISLDWIQCIIGGVFILSIIGILFKSYGWIHKKSDGKSEKMKNIYYRNPSIDLKVDNTNTFLVRVVILSEDSSFK